MRQIELQFTYHNGCECYVWTVVYEMNTKAIFYGNEFYLSSSESKIAFIFIS